MKKILLSLLLISSLFSQANRILTIAPTAQTSSIGNVMLPMMNPARNLFNKDHFSFSRVNWMTNIVSDMNYNFLNMDRGPFGVNIMFFNYGEQNQADESGVIQGTFTPLSAVYGFNYARKVDKYNLGLSVKLITHDLHTQSAKGLVLGIGSYFPKVYKDLDNCSHTKYDYERRTTKIYKNIQSEVGSNTEIVLRRYKNSQTGKSHYQIVKYFLCSKCYEYRICKGMSAIDLNHKEFKELIDGYINS